WFSREAKTRNPFFGSAMLECGEELDAAPAAPDAHKGHGGGSAALPAGHPPIDFARYLLALSQSESAATTDGCCAGHTPEQAAACAHAK
ncbi:MAG TPA: hypothetical protein VFJ90_11020, partial [Candidatus Didemnitutus sp.]|nr:hypothetical protein [Candidatus Didemnitutus sp.]